MRPALQNLAPLTPRAPACLRLCATRHVPSRCRRRHEHVATITPYSLLAAGLALSLGHLPVGLGWYGPLTALTLSTAALVGIVLGFGVTPPAGAPAPKMEPGESIEGKPVPHIEDLPEPDTPAETATEPARASAPITE